MSYLVFNPVAHPALLVQAQPETAEIETPTVPALSEQQMKEICGKASDYLSSSKGYLRPDLSLVMLAKETGIPQHNLSRAINTYLERNFFEFINEMRVEEAKKRLVELNASGYRSGAISRNRP